MSAAVYGYGSYVNNNVDRDDTINPSLPFSDTGGKGWLGTVIGGCDYQVGSSFVIGAFVDFDWTSTQGTWRDRAGANNVSGTFKETSAWAGGGRIGYLAESADVAVPLRRLHAGSLRSVGLRGLQRRSRGCQIHPGSDLLRRVHRRWHGAMFIPNWAVRLEYRYSQFSHDINRYVTTTGAFSTLVSEKLSTQTIRADLVYRFNWGKAPVIAKY